MDQSAESEHGILPGSRHIEDNSECNAGWTSEEFEIDGQTETGEIAGMKNFGMRAWALHHLLHLEYHYETETKTRT